MTEDDRIHGHAEQQDPEHGDPTRANEINVAADQRTHEPEIEQPAPTHDGIVQQIWRRIQEDRRKPKRVEIKTRSQNNMDRSKAFLVLGTVVVLVGFAFLALFSTSGAQKRAQEHRNHPNLGRPASSAQRSRRPGSTVPLLSAEQATTDPNADQLSPEDIQATARRTESAKQAEKAPKASAQYALANAPTFDDPALDAYRKQKNYTYTPPPPPAPPAAKPVAAPVSNESDALTKSSLIFVRSVTSAATTSVPSNIAQPAVIEPRESSALLPAGSHLVARLQTAISSAVKMPAIAVIEYNYERDGEIVIPAGTKAVGQLTQANQNGQIGLRFTALEMPDGNSVKIEGSAVSLDYGPLKGRVNGQNRLKRALVRSLTGIGSMAAYVVGGPGYGGLSGPVDQSILLRERIASNAGLAGEQELMGLAYNQNIVVTLAGNTRFYIILQEPAASPAQTGVTPASTTRTNLASTDGQAVPTAAELRELISLKEELNRMYQEVEATKAAQAPIPQQ